MVGNDAYGISTFKASVKENGAVDNQGLDDGPTNDHMD